MNQKQGSDTDAESEFLAPDGTWGIIVVIICTAILAFLVLCTNTRGRVTE